MDKLELEDVLREEGRINKRVEDYLSSLHYINQGFNNILEYVSGLYFLLTYQHVIKIFVS